MRWIKKKKSNETKSPEAMLEANTNGRTCPKKNVAVNRFPSLLFPAIGLDMKSILKDHIFFVDEKLISVEISVILENLSVVFRK